MPNYKQQVSKTMKKIKRSISDIDLLKELSNVDQFLLRNLSYESLWKSLLYIPVYPLITLYNCYKIKMNNIH